ncbi:MAG: capsule assembly Wzi family protein [Bacteroidales bacterium]|nr:capsule assembly Wzi family protein [Bacteroidales bacterium]
MIRFTITFTALILLSISLAFAQVDSSRLRSDITLVSTFGTSNDQSFWLTHNRWGIFDDASANGLALLSGSYSLNNERYFSLGAGLDLVARASNSSKAYIQQGYIEAKLGFVHLEVGRKQSIHGIDFGRLSSGSVAISNNTVPIPQVVLSIPEFTKVPYTFGLLEFKGHFAHGWLDNSRFVTNAYHHNKSFHVQLGGDIGINAYWGINHTAIWGGSSPVHGELPSSLSDFLRVIVAKEGADGSPANEVNALGFHSGVWDWGIKARIGEANAHLYYQHIFTDGSGKRYQNKFDGLWGARVENPFSSRFITEILYEFLYTLHQSGPGLSDPHPNDPPDFCDQPNCGYPYGGRDNYYNNGMYRSGHSYLGMSLGSPFFLTQRQLDKIDPSIRTYSSAYFVSNRNIAHHFGLKGEVHNHLSYRFLASYVRYFGTYPGLNMGQLWGSIDPSLDHEEYFFNPDQRQWYLMLESSWQPKKDLPLKLNTTLAADKGDLFNSMGIMIGIIWNIH